jgi:hypothetical protein
VPCNSIDEINKARQAFRGEEYSKTKVVPSQVEPPKVEAHKVARVIHPTKPRKMV